VSTKSPIRRIPTVLDPLTRVPQMMDGPDCIGESRIAISLCTNLLSPGTPIPRSPTLREPLPRVPARGYTPCNSSRSNDLRDFYSRSDGSDHFLARPPLRLTPAQLLWIQRLTGNVNRDLTVQIRSFGSWDLRSQFLIAHDERGQIM
jgi:hypothetical protein